MDIHDSDNHKKNGWFPTIVDTLVDNPEEGPLTASYGLDAEQVRQVLDRAIASEMVAFLSYTAQALAARGIRAQTVAREFEEHAQQELGHAQTLLTRLDELGGTPRLDPASIGKLSIHAYEGGGKLDAMLRYQLEAERRAVEFYRDAIQWLGDKDPTTRRVFEDILAVEERHANDLQGLCANIDR